MHKLEMQIREVRHIMNVETKIVIMLISMTIAAIPYILFEFLVRRRRIEPYIKKLLEGNKEWTVSR